MIRHDIDGDRPYPGTEFAPYTSSRLTAFARFVVAGFAVIALVAAQLVLSAAIHGTNYGGGDGKLAQATILTAYKFASFLQFNIINPTQGLGSQLLPMNVWVNPAYWPFAFLPKELATDVSAAIALGIFVIAGYIMARCFDVPVVPSAIGAQLSIILFAPAAFIFQLATVFCIMTGNAVVYAPHMIALGLLARLEPGSWRDFGLTTAGIFALLFYSLCCDPLWSMVHGFGWAASFVVVAFGGLQLKTILVRCASLGCCVVLLFLSGAVEYAYTLTRYTARIQFPGTGDRPVAPDLLASEIFYSPYVKYFYLVWSLGWLLGLLTLSGRARLLVITGLVSFLLLFGYTLLYLLLNVPWQAPLPVYLAHGLVPLFVISAVAGYWGGLRVATRSARRIVVIMTQRAGDARSRLGVARRALLPVPRLFHGDGAPARSRLRFLTAAAVFIAVGIIPAAVVDFAIWHGSAQAERFHEHWPNEPELTQFFDDEIGLEVGRLFRGSVHFWPYDYAIGLTVKGLWARGIPTVMQYGQLVTPPSFYFATTLAKQPRDANRFILVPKQSESWESYEKALQLVGARYYVVAPQGFPPSVRANFPARTFPYRPLSGEDGLWYVYEIPDPNLGNYSPTQVMTAHSGAEIAGAEPNFDFTTQVVLSAQVSQPLVPARDMRLSLIRGGLHVSGHSDGSSLVVLPLQFSHCLRARDERVRLVRANLMMTGMIFSRDVDTDILFDYGILSPRCRSADLADMRRLDLRINVPMRRVTGDSLLPDWKSALATVTAATSAVK
jgi:hypothetical protein